jgi:hypothetical protein
MDHPVHKAPKRIKYVITIKRSFAKLRRFFTPAE